MKSNSADRSLSPSWTAFGSDIEEPGPRLALGHPFRALLPIGTGLVLMFFLLGIFGKIDDPLGSLFAVSMSCGIALLFVAGSHARRRLGDSIVALTALVFVIKVGIGMAHYLTFFEPGYFAHPTGGFWWNYDFGQLPEAMRIVSGFWKSNGFVGLPETTLGDKAPLLVAYHSLLYYFSGPYFLNFILWSSFHTILVGFLISSMALRFGATARQARFAFVVAALQPLYLYSDLPQRDMIGQFFLVLAIYLVMNSLGNKIYLLAVLPVSAILVHAQRTVYPVPLLGFVSGALFFSKKKKRAVGLLGLGAVLVVYFFPVLWRLTGLGYYAARPSDFGRPFALRTALSHLVIGFLGPFPWTQIIEVPATRVHLPMEFLQCWLALAIWMIVIPRVVRQWRTLRTLDLGFLAAVPFFLTGVLSDAVHTGYTNIGTVFLLPLACQAPRSEWTFKIVAAGGVYLAAHSLFFALGLHGKGAFL